jgi:hypothetical protein
MARRGAKSVVALMIASVRLRRVIPVPDRWLSSVRSRGRIMDGTWTDHGWMAQVIRSGVAICTRLFPARSAARVLWCEARPRECVISGDVLPTCRRRHSRRSAALLDRGAIVLVLGAAACLLFCFDMPACFPFFSTRVSSRRTSHSTLPLDYNNDGASEVCHDVRLQALQIRLALQKHRGDQHGCRLSAGDRSRW